MPTPRIDEARLTVITRAYVVHSPLSRNTARPHRVQVLPRAAANERAMTQEAGMGRGNFAKGFAWTLTIEGAAVLAIYAAWHFGHLLPLHF